MDDNQSAGTVCLSPADRSGPVSVRTVMAVAELNGCQPTELQPLSESVDPDALDALVAHPGNSLELSFEFADATVTVLGTGEIRASLSGD